MSQPIQLDAEILDNRLVTCDHYVMSLAAPPIAAGARPGQFVMLRPSAGADPLLPRALAFYGADPAAGRIDLLYRVVGIGTRLLSELRAGASVALWGPLGTAFALAPAGRAEAVGTTTPGPPGRSASRHLLVGGGIGVPPLVFLAETARRAASGADGFQALIGAATKEYLVGEAELRAAGVPVTVATDDGTRGHRGFVTDLLREALGRDGGPATVYACGPNPMLAAVAHLRAAAGVPCQVSLEAPMACGVGACLGCTVPLAAGGYARVCTEGPVFDATAIAWEALGAID
jgi:dihydroorotate dehydrogenase electron transfer subunit